MPFKQDLVLVGLRRFRSAKKAQTITGQRVNLDYMIFLDLSGFQRFWASRSKSQAGIGVEAFLDLFFV